ncbi:MAG: GGDEF domain-containing protein [Lachnospiraceae bacterium]|nr:GGDEF domain-containing protein [Lachnospiraceae bacterium]
MDNCANENINYNEAEYTANKYVLRCTGIMTTSIVIVWILNTLNIFVVNQGIVTKALISALVVYFAGRLFFYKIGIKKAWVKYVLMLWAVGIGTIMVMFLTYHTVIGALIPMIYAGMYCNKRMSAYTYFLVVLSIFVSVFGGYYYGICDANMVLLTTENLSSYVKDGEFTLTSVNDNVVYTLTLFYVVPRAMICFIVSAIANSVSKIITENMNYAKEMKKLAEYDGMTGVYNKSKYIEIISNANDSNENVAVIFWDVNDLKKINDTEGHEKGDELIISVGKIISKMVTVSDSAFRIGGDEFVLIMNGSGKKELDEKLELWKNLLHDANKNTDINISVSYGYSCGTKKDIVKLIADADKMMYENKRKYKEKKAYEEE